MFQELLVFTENYIEGAVLYVINDESNMKTLNEQLLYACTNH